MRFSTPEGRVREARPPLYRQAPPLPRTRASPGYSLSNHGNSVLQDAGIVIVAGTLAQQDGSAWYSYDLIEALHGSAYWGELSQYGVNGIEYAGYFPDIQNTEDTLYQYAIEQNMAILWIPDKPPIDQPGFAYNIDYWAYHTFAGVPIAVVPYPGFNPGLYGWTIEQALSRLISHELVEMATDTQPGNGWYSDSNGDEACDLAASWQTVNLTSPNNETYAVECYWDNKSGSVYGPTR